MMVLGVALVILAVVLALLTLSVVALVIWLRGVFGKH